jgi:pantetheine-phosphate adenylyltransferase
VIVRGARNSTDFNYESQIAQMNNTMDKTLESIFFIASDPFKSITSSLVREVIIQNGDYSKFVSQDVTNFLGKIKE